MPSPSALSAFATIGLALAIVYLLASTLMSGTLLVARSRRAAGAGLRRPPGAYLAQEVASVERRLRRHGFAVLLFLVSFGLLFTLGRDDAWPVLPAWISVLMAIVVTAAALVEAVKAIALARYHRRLVTLLDADLSVAQRLDEVQRRGHRVFHAVPVGDRVIDHVIVGTIGIFAVQVVVPERAGAAGVSMVRGSLVFGPAHGEFRLQATIEAFAKLAKEIGRLVGHPVKIVPTLIVPGCRISTWDDDRYLLTNEQNCVTLVGWKDSSAYLMDDEVVRIADWLSARCQPQGLRAWIPRQGALHACVTRPGLL